MRWHPGVWSDFCSNRAVSAPFQRREAGSRPSKRATMTVETKSPHTPSVDTVVSVVVRICGDSGDGIQVTGDQFTTSTAIAGNDLATLPDFPAEIRAPAGT